MIKNIFNIYVENKEYENISDIGFCSSEVRAIEIISEYNILYAIIAEAVKYFDELVEKDLQDHTYYQENSKLIKSLSQEDYNNNQSKIFDLYNINNNIATDIDNRYDLINLINEKLIENNLNLYDNLDKISIFIDKSNHSNYYYSIFTNGQSLTFNYKSLICLD